MNMAQSQYRPRRVGWFDAVVARYTSRLAGIDNWALMLFGVLSGLDKVKICTHYELDGKDHRHSPIHNLQTRTLQNLGVYRDGRLERGYHLALRAFGELPEAAKAYVRKDRGASRRCL